MLVGILNGPPPTRRQYKCCVNEGHSDHRDRLDFFFTFQRGSEGSLQLLMRCLQ